ncbi:hypothetical protein GW901_01135 [Candidatus Parcubacteria bacterium]|nr:hypothetical protein [Candidatus Parcubacteria bacterium]
MEKTTTRPPHPPISRFARNRPLNKLTCKTGLRENVIKEEVFEREIVLCQMLSKENKGKCGWGKCKDCGVIPLLIKLHKGQLLEDPAKIAKIKKRILK